MENKVLMRFYTSANAKNRIEKLAELTGHSMSFFCDYLVARYLDEIESAFVAGKDVKDAHNDNMDRDR